MGPSNHDPAKHLGVNMDWGVWVLVIVVVVALGWLAWWSSGRTPKAAKHGEHWPGSQSQYRSGFGGPGNSQ